MAFECCEVQSSELARKTETIEQGSYDSLGVWLRDDSPIYHSTMSEQHLTYLSISILSCDVQTVPRILRAVEVVGLATITQSFSDSSYGTS